MAYKKQIFEILRELDGKNHSEKVHILQANDNPTLRLMLRQNFDDSITYKLPDTEPPFKKQDVPIGYTENTLYADTRRLSYLFTNPPQNIRKVQLEGLFISLLESLHPNECVVLLAVKDKKLGKVFNVTSEDVMKAFPGLLPIPTISSEVLTEINNEIKEELVKFTEPEKKLKIRDIKGRPKTETMIIPFI